MFGLGLLALTARVCAAEPDTGDQTAPAAAPAADEDGLHPPELLAPLVPTWPAAADPEAGPVTVRLELEVDDDGRVTQVTLIDVVAAPLDPAPFAAAALAAARAARLKPAHIGDFPVPVTVPLTVTFLPPPVNLEGTVTLSGGGELPAAGVTVRAGGLTAVTDTAGRFRLRGVPAGPVTVDVVGPGLTVAPVELTLPEGEAVSVQLRALPDVADPGIVGRYRVGRAEVARRSLDAAELRAMPGSLGDPLRAVGNLPGTSRSPLETGWLLVRGGDPRDTAVYIDGVRVPMVYHLGGYTSVIHPAFLDRVDFLPSGGGARSGRSTAGTVDVITRPGGDTPEARVGANLVFAGAYGNVVAGPLKVSAAVRRSYLDAVLSPFLPEAAAASIPRFWDWQLRLDLGADHSLFGFGFADTLTTYGADGAAANLEVATERVHERSRFAVGGRTLTVTPSFSWEHVRLDVAAWEHTSLRENLGGGLRVELEDDATAAWSPTVGLDAEAFSASVQSDAYTRTEPVWMPDVYADVRVGRDDQLTVGARLDTLFVGDQPARLGVSPRVSGRWSASPRFRLEAEAGGHHEPPPWELLLGPPEGADLELDEAWGGSLTAIATFGPLELSVDGFGRALTRVTEVEVDGSLRQGTGYAAGAEVSAELHLPRLLALAHVGYTRSMRQEDADAEAVPSPYDQPLTIGVVATYDLGRRWTLGGRFRYGSGFPLSADDAVVYDVLALRSVPVPLYDGRAEAFHALDLKVSHRFLFRTWRLDAWIDVQNVYDHRVPEPVVTGLADLTFRDMGLGLFVLPIFGVEGQWGGDPRRP